MELIINYSDTIIYNITCLDTNVTQNYVGMTTNYTQRLQSHIYTCNNHNHKSYNLKLYRCIRANGGTKNWLMIILERYSCNNQTEARTRERYWFEQLHADLNCIRPLRYENDTQKLNTQLEEYVTIPLLSHYEFLKLQKKGLHQITNATKKSYDKTNNLYLLFNIQEYLFKNNLNLGHFKTLKHLKLIC